MSDALPAVPLPMIAISFTPTAAESDAVVGHARRMVSRQRIDNRALDALFFVAVLCGTCGVLGAAQAAYAWPGAHLDEIRIAALAASAGYVFMVIWAYARHAAVGRALTQALRGRLDAMTVRISEGGFAFETLAISVSYPWSSIQRIETLAEFALFFTSIDEAHYLPARAFESREAFGRFVVSARDWHAQATTGFPPAPLA